MKEINIIIVLLASFNFFTIKAYDWVLEIKNENNTEEQIELRPGKLTKVLLILSHELFFVFWDKTLLGDANFTIASKDNNIKFYPKEEINIIPSESNEYVTYIGLDCNHGIEGIDYNLNVDIISRKDLDGNDRWDYNLKIKTPAIRINNSPTYIDILPIETNLTSRGFSLFKISNEIYNIEKLKIKPDNFNRENLKIENIEIKPFIDRKKKFGKDENDNHGILFEYKFGTLDKNPESRGQINETFKLVMDYSDADHTGTCFFINPEYEIVNITINENNSTTLNESVKETILYSIEKGTPKINETNNIQIKMNIPVAPIIIKCHFDGDGKDEKRDNIEYKDYILNSGQYIMKINNLNLNNQYKGDCLFSSTSNTSPLSEFRITIGNEKEKEFSTILYPSKSFYVPQCVELILTSNSKDNLEEQIEEFGDLAKMYCNYKMNLNENIISKIMGHFACEKLNIKIDDQHNKNKIIICTGPSPSYVSESIKKEDIEILQAYFSNYFDNFIGHVNSTENIYNITFLHKELADLQFVSLTRYYDSYPPDVNKIKIELVKNNELDKKDKLNFRINSSNDQPIECFYNEEMKVDDTKKSLNLYHSKAGSKSIILYPNEEKSFETHLKDFTEKNIYTLFMNCYNLPGARIRYKQTGIFNAYTYFYGDISEEEESDFEKQNVTINCAEKQNKANPNCLKGAYNNLDEMLKTKMPETDENEELEKFTKLSNNSKNHLLDGIFDSFDEEMEKLNTSAKIIKNLINKEKMLVFKDCSIFSNESSKNSLNEKNDKEYKKCRENKKIKQKKIIDYLKKNFTCESLSSLISKNGISRNVEDNMKYLILLIEEVTNKVDSFAEGDSKIMLNMITCIQENFEDYWKQLKEYLDERGVSNITISEVKQDISNILINSMSNLVKVLHFDEIDNYISENEKNFTNNGLMVSKTGKQIYKTMKQFMKNFNEFEDGLYNLSDSLIINVTINNDYKDKPLYKDNELDEKAIKYEDKGIILLLHPQSMMKKFDAYAMQIINYDSPLISVKTDANTNYNIVNTFISITLYDKKGNEIKVDQIPEDIRPKILYDKEYHKYMDSCFFYNEKIEDLSEKGVSINKNYTYDGNEYLECTAEHLTCFTAGQYFIKSSSSTSEESNQEKGVMTLIILGSIFAVILILVIIIIIVKRKRRKNNMLDDNENLKKNMVDMELFEKE